MNTPYFQQGVPWRQGVWKIGGCVGKFGILRFSCHRSRRKKNTVMVLNYFGEQDTVTLNIINGGPLTYCYSLPRRILKMNEC